jgi:hypothetical protein
MIAIAVNCFVTDPSLNWESILSESTGLKLEIPKEWL